MIGIRFLVDEWWMSMTGALNPFTDLQALNRFDSNSFDRTQQPAAIQPSNPCILPQDVDPMDPIH